MSTDYVYHNVYHNTCVVLLFIQYIVSCTSTSGSYSTNFPKAIGLRLLFVSMKCFVKQRDHAIPCIAKKNLYYDNVFLGWGTSDTMRSIYYSCLILRNKTGRKLIINSGTTVVASIEDIKLFRLARMLSLWKDDHQLCKSRIMSPTESERYLWHVRLRAETPIVRRWWPWHNVLLTLITLIILANHMPIAHIKDGRKTDRLVWF